MARLPPPQILQKLNQKNGSQPILIFEVNWGLGSEFYGTKTISNRCKGKILSIGSLEITKREDSYGSSGSISLTLDDSDGWFKSVYDNALMQNAPCALHLTYADLDFASRFVVFRGHIVGAPEWSEGTRILSLQIETEVVNNEIGYTPTKDDFRDIRKDAEAVPWPLVFGTCKSVPALHIHGRPVTFLISDIKLEGDVYQIDNTANGRKITLTTNQLQVRDLSTNEINKIYFEDTSEFPDGVITVNIDGVLFKGHVNNANRNQFVVQEVNIAQYTDVHVGDRPAGESARDETRFKLIYLQDDVKITLQNKVCYYEMSNQLLWNFCEKQEGVKCTFTHDFFNPTNGQRVALKNTTFKEVFAVSKWGVLNESFKKLSSYDLIGTKLRHYWHAKHALTFYKANSMWSAPAGTEVQGWDLDDQEVYIASAVELNSIDNVYGRKQIKLRSNKDTYILRSINSKYYNIQLQANYEVNGALPSGILMPIPMQTMEHGQWKDTIYTDATSTVGPNTADIIKYILAHYTTFSIDTGSFALVASQINNVPSHFALFDNRDALEICREIAWQARCVLIQDNETISIKYLAVAPLSAMTFNTTNIELDTIELTSTPINEITTRLIGTWTDSYADFRSLVKHHNKEAHRVRELVHALTEKSENRGLYDKLTVYRENINRYDLHTKNTRVYIYNNEDSVKKTLKFWGHRYANPWKLIKFKTFMPALMLEPFDGITIDVPALFTVPLLATVYDMKFDYQDKSVEIEAWLPIIQGRNSVDPYAYSGVP